MLVYIDGRLVPESEARVSVLDHGFLYGDGVFEGIRVYGGRIFRFHEHLDRLWNSARVLRLSIPWSREEVEQATIETLQANELTDAYIRLIVSRGVGDLGLDPDHCPKPSLIIITRGIQIYPEEMYRKGLRVITSSVRRTSGAALPPQAKTMNYLNNIMGKIEAKNSGFIEAIMLNSEGFVVEGTSDNLFIFRENQLLTPDIHSGALPGITRGVVIDLAREQGIEVDTPLITKFDLYTSDECFLTGTAAEVIPVVEIDGRPVGDGQVGPVTSKLMEAFRERTRIEGVPVYQAEAAS